MSDGNGNASWLILAYAAIPGSIIAAGPKVLNALWGAWRSWCGYVSAATIAQERVEIDERAQLAQRQVALDARSDAEVARLAAVHVDLRANLAAEIASGARWYQVARAWHSRAWDKLDMARNLIAAVCEAREGWAQDRRGWFAAEPDTAAAARRPAWMGPPPDFVVSVPDPIPDPPGLEELLK